MIVDLDIQIISAFGWLEITNKIAKLRKDGQVSEIATADTASMHIHTDGITVSLPPHVISHLVKCIEYEFSHDPQGKPLPTPEAKPIRLVIRS